MLKFFSLCAAAVLVAVIGTAAISRRRKRRALRNLPAPPSPSFVTGTILCLCSCSVTRVLLANVQVGNLLDLYTEGALPLHTKLTQQYGGVIKYDGLFKVCSTFA